MKNEILNKDYTNFIIELKQKIYSAKSTAILSANRLMIELYFDIGNEIIQKQEKFGWGKSIVEKMSKDLKNEFGEKSGYSTQNLWYMRQFYIVYKDDTNLQQLVGDLPWGQNILIFSKCKDIKEREYYIKNTIEFGWNRNVLTHHIKTDLYKRDKLINTQNNFNTSLKENLSELAIDIVKSEYNLEFLEVAKFKPEYAGKMNFYLNLLNDTVKMPHENPSIGIILCTDKESFEVEYALRNLSQPMGVSTYTTNDTLPSEFLENLPTKEELERKLGGLLNEKE